MTALDYADLRRLLAEGTPGPWEVDEVGGLWIQEADGQQQLILRTTELDSDAALIAAAVNALPALLDAAAEREALIRERDALLAERNMAMDMHEVQWQRANRLDAERDVAADAARAEVRAEALREVVDYFRTIDEVWGADRTRDAKPGGAS